jgi:5-methylcytosine-specific restriction protein A
MTYRDNPEIAKKYKSKRWQKLRKQKLMLNPLCERCLKKDINIAAYFIHHKEYVTDNNYIDDNIFFNIDNLESLCKKCHNQEHFEKEVEYIFDENGDLIKK